MALSDRCIVTLEQAKDYLGINPDNTAKDEILEKWIDWVSSRFEQDIGGNKVAAQIVTVYLDGTDTEKLVLPYYPVLALYGADETERLTSLTVDDTAVLSADADLLISSVYPDTIELIESGVFTAGAKNVHIKYYAGWARDDIPGDIVICILEQIKQMWNESGQGGGRLGLQGQTLGTSGEQLSFTDLGPRWDKVVRRYVKSVHNVELYR